MSKASKARQAEKRRKQKSTAKAAARAQYTAWRDQGINQKSKRAKLRAKRSKRAQIRTVSHPTGRCFNHGCSRCQPELNSPLNALHTSCIYGKQFTSRKWRNVA